MLVGIDVGGTHTDAVALKDGEPRAHCKVRTDHDNLLVSVRAALEDILATVKPHEVARINLSTTLSTNAIVEGKTEDVGVLVSGGPGVDPEEFRIGRGFFLLDGAMDHRGEEISPLTDQELARAVACCRELGISVFASVGKFSTRNPAHEQRIAQAIRDNGGADFITMGHRLSGLLNFPRRIATAYYNAAVWRIYNDFADAVEASIREYGLECPVNVLKADGGTVPFGLSREFPVESIRSGPAASIMGIIALCDIREDCTILDIGGTTTDIAIFSSGEPVIENQGIEVGSYPTLVRALRTVSIGVGGDSRLHVAGGVVRVGPEREGPSRAQGGKTATLMDAFNYLGLAQVGDRERSRTGIERLAGLWDMFPDKLARDAVDRAVASIKEAIDGMVWDINEQPVYTIGELLRDSRLVPSRCYLMGGPARSFKSLLEKALGQDVVVPEHFQVANAIGAALTRVTTEVELFADTRRGRLLIPTLGVERDIPSGYTREDAERDALDSLADHLATCAPEEFDQYGLDAQIAESEVFNMVDDYGLAAKNIRVKCRIRPGILKAGSKC